MEDSQNIQPLIKILTSSHDKSDSEKLAALLLLTKLTRASQLCKDDEIKIFQSIPFEFVIKLLLTKSQPDDCPSACYKSIALSILKSFSTYPFEDASVTHQVLNAIMEIINPVSMKNEEIDDKMEGDILVFDAHVVLRLMMQSQNAKEIVFKSNALKILSAIIFNMDSGLHDALTSFLIIICHKDLEESNKKEFMKLLENLAIRLSDRMDCKLLEVLDMFVRILENPDVKDILYSLNAEDFWKILLESLYNIMTSKIDIIYCQKALLVSSYVINLYGFTWPILKQHESMVLILLHLASIEIRMILDELQENQSGKSLALLEGLTTLFIEAIKYVGENRSKRLSLSSCKLTIETIQELIFDCIYTTVNFMKNCYDLDNQLENNLLNPCLCLLSAYISFKEFALDEDIVHLVPIIINACCKDLSISTTTIEDIDATEHLNEEKKLVCSNLLHLFLPGLEHLTHLDEVRQCFKEKNFIPVLIDYMKISAVSNKQDDVYKIVDIFYNFFMSNELTDAINIFNYLSTNFSIFNNHCNILILLFAIMSSQSSSINIKKIEVHKYVTSGIKILKNKHCHKDLKEDLISHMSKCFSIYPEFSNFVSEHDYKNIFII